MSAPSSKAAAAAAAAFYNMHLLFALWHIVFKQQKLGFRISCPCAASTACRPINEAPACYHLLLPKLRHLFLRSLALPSQPRVRRRRHPVRPPLLPSTPPPPPDSPCIKMADASASDREKDFRTACAAALINSKHASYLWSLKRLVKEDLLREGT
jgi:hypothetical protein